MAFADDITSVARDAAEAQLQSAIVQRHLETLGMGLSVNKCAAFEYVLTRDAWYVRNPNLSHKGVAIPMANPEEVFKGD